MRKKDNYIELHVNIRPEAIWYKELEKQLKRKSRRWIYQGFHITAAFMKDDLLKEKLAEGLNDTL